MEPLDYNELFFKKDELSGASLRLCPSCLGYNPEEHKNCDSCCESIPSYSVDSFFTYRKKYLASQGRIEASKLGLEASNDLDLKAYFEMQWDLWQPVQQVRRYLNHFLMMPITTNDSLLEFMGRFPITHELLRETQRDDVQLEFTSFDCQLLSQKLREIERKDLYAQAAFWLRVYTEENNHKLVLEQLEWMNVAYGYYVDGRPRRIDENNPQEVQQSLDFTANLNNCGWYSKEVALFPMHWKFLCLDYLSEKDRSWISWHRYAFLIRNWVPNKQIEKIWKNLALSYATKGAEPIADYSKKYYMEEIEKPWNQADKNFLLSFSIVTKCYDEKIWNANLFKDSFYSILVLFMRPELQSSFWINFELQPQWLRALNFFDFSKYPYVNFVAEKMVKNLPPDKWKYILDSVHKSLLAPLLEASFLSHSTEVFEVIKDKISNQESVRAVGEKVLSSDILSVKSDFLKEILLGDSRNWFFQAKHRQILFVTFSGDEKVISHLLEKFVQDSHQNQLPIQALCALIFHEWLESVVLKKTELIEQILQRVYFFTRQSGLEGNQRVKDQLRSLYQSEDEFAFNNACEWIERMDDKESVEFLYSPPPAQGNLALLLRAIRSEKYQKQQNAAVKHLIQEIGEKRFSDIEIRALKQQLSTLPSYEVDSIKSKLEKVETASSSTSEISDKAKDNIVRELEQRIKQMETSLETSRIQKEALEKNIETMTVNFQKSMESSQKIVAAYTWYIGEVQKLLFEPLDLMERVAKFSTISQEFQSRLV